MKNETEENRLGDLGSKYFSEGNYKMAQQCFLTASEIAEKRGDKSSQVLWLGNLSGVFVSLGQFKEAIVHSEKALKIAQKINDQEAEMHILSNLGIAYFSLELDKIAIKYLGEGLKIARRTQNKEHEANFSGLLGNVFSASGAFAMAESHYNFSLWIAEKFGDNKGIGVWTGNLGNNYLAMHEYEKAIHHFEKALKIAKEEGDLENENKWLQGLAKAQKALEKQQDIKHRKLIENSVEIYGAIVEKLGMFISALPSVEEKFDYLLSQRHIISSFIKEAIHEAEPWVVFTLIDNIKSLISRELHSRKRAYFTVGKNVDFVTHGFKPYKVAETLLNEPDMGTISFYYTDDFEFYAFLAYVKDGEPKVEKITIGSFVMVVAFIQEFSDL